MTEHRLVVNLYGDTHERIRRADCTCGWTGRAYLPLAKDNSEDVRVWMQADFKDRVEQERGMPEHGTYIMVGLKDGRNTYTAECSCGCVDGGQIIRSSPLVVVSMTRRSGRPVSTKQHTINSRSRT